MIVLPVEHRRVELNVAEPIVHIYARVIVRAVPDLLHVFQHVHLAADIIVEKHVLKHVENIVQQTVELNAEPHVILHVMAVVLQHVMIIV